MDAPPIGQEVLRRFINRAGGVHAAALQLGLPPTALTSYVNGFAPVTEPILMRAVEILVDELERRMSKPPGSLTGA